MPNATFFPWRTVTSKPLHEATVTSTNEDGTVNLISHDGWDTPQASVPVLKPGDDVPMTGFYAVLGPQEEAPEPLPAQEEQDQGPSGEAV